MSLNLYQVTELERVIKDVHSQHGDDLCWMDIDRIFQAADLPIPDRCVGDKEAMKLNCHRFIDGMCKEGKWKSYADLEKELQDTRKELQELRLKITEDYNVESNS